MTFEDSLGHRKADLRVAGQGSYRRGAEKSAPVPFDRESMQFEHTSSKIADADLDEVEVRFGFRFPSAFRDHYLGHNGGRPKKNYFVDDARRVWIVHQFLPIRQSVTPKVSTLERCVQWLKVEQALIPDHLIPFANDSFGNLYCFSIREENCGAIYWLKMEGRRKADGEFLSDSLDDFLKKLKTKEEVQLTDRDEN